VDGGTPRGAEYMDRSGTMSVMWLEAASDVDSLRLMRDDTHLSSTSTRRDSLQDLPTGILTDCSVEMHPPFAFLQKDVLEKPGEEVPLKVFKWLNPRETFLGDSSSDLHPTDDVYMVIDPLGGCVSRETMKAFRVGTDSMDTKIGTDAMMSSFLGAGTKEAFEEAGGSLRDTFVNGDPTLISRHTDSLKVNEVQHPRDFSSSLINEGPIFRDYTGLTKRDVNWTSFDTAPRVCESADDLPRETITSVQPMNRVESPDVSSSRETISPLQPAAVNRVCESPDSSSHETISSLQPVDVPAELSELECLEEEDELVHLSGRRIISSTPPLPPGFVCLSAFFTKNYWDIVFEVIISVSQKKSEISAGISAGKF